jgi:glycerol-3-phosphate dehydrogenase (NAD(P)+)
VTSSNSSILAPFDVPPDKERYAKRTLTVVGAGAWGQAIAHLASLNDHDIHLWSRRSDISLAEGVRDVDLIVSAISMKGVPDIAARVAEAGISERSIIVTATKGLDPLTLRTPSQIWQSALPQHPVVVLSGPNLSKEIQQGLPAATVVASESLEAAELVQTTFSSDRFRVYTNPDPIGTELGGTLKNVMAIAVGVCDGMQLGTNAKAALISRGLTEIVRIGMHFGGQMETFSGLSGLGDLLATCSSALSRNYQVGFGLAQGKTLDEIIAHLEGTAEGVNTAAVMVALANREGIPIPITRTVNRLLKGLWTPQEAVEALMERELKPEFCEI